MCGAFPGTPPADAGNELRTLQPQELNVDPFPGCCSKTGYRGLCHWAPGCLIFWWSSALATHTVEQETIQLRKGDLRHSDAECDPQDEVGHNSDYRLQSASSGKTRCWPTSGTVPFWLPTGPADVPGNYGHDIVRDDIAQALSEAAGWLESQPPLQGTQVSPEWASAKETRVAHIVDFLRDYCVEAFAYKATHSATTSSSTTLARLHAHPHQSTATMTRRELTRPGGLARRVGH